MFSNRKFTYYALTVCLTGLVYTFLCAALDEGTVRLVRAFATGWSAEEISLPMTVGRFAAVPLAVVCCRAIDRSGVRASLIVCTALAALGCLGLVCANGLDVCGGAVSGRYGLFALSLALIPCACTLIRLSLAALCIQWFIRFRGRALAVVFLGGPLFSAVGAAALVNFVAVALGGDYRPFYLGAAVLLALLALIVRYLLRDRPEDAGLYPDGDGRAPAGEGEGPAPPAKLARDGRLWLVLLAACALAFAAAGTLEFLEGRLLAKGGGGPTLLNRAAPWLALGAILSIPAGYIAGWLGDRVSAAGTAALLGLADLAAIALLWRFPKEVDLITGLPLALTGAIVTGGTPVVLAACVGRVFGRTGAPRAGQLIYPAAVLAAALTGPVGAALGGGARARLYAVLAAAACVGVLACLVLLAVDRKKRDE